MAKLFASEAAHRAADKAMQILASTGYRRGSVVERLFRDVRATEIYQGTSEVAADGDRGDPHESRSGWTRPELQPSQICFAIVCSCRFDVPS